MLIEKIRCFFLNYKYRRSIRAKKKENYRPKSKIKNVGVILDDSLQIDEAIFENLITHFGVSKANLKFLILTETPQTESEPDSVFVKYYLRRSDFGVFGNLKQDIIPFFNLNFDLIVNYFDEENPYLAYVSSLNKRCFTLGFSGADKNLNDLIFDFGAFKTNAFLKESKKYLQTIFKK